ncbi:MAG: acetolactate synthase small subunit, partial [Gammaproteobacteria bacterium]|nr:acetolactate synthase small subunit [Gammaproteobacteria bacterium]
IRASAYTVQLTGPSDKLDAFLRAVGSQAVIEVARSGVAGIGRGDKVLSLG